MKKELYYRKADAMAAAQDFAADCNGVIHKNASLQWCSDFDYIDRDAHNIDWSGETSAFEVVSEDGETALFGYLD